MAGEVRLPCVFESDLRSAAGFEVASTSSSDAWGVVSNTGRGMLTYDKATFCSTALLLLLYSRPVEPYQFIAEYLRLHL